MPNADCAAVPPTMDEARKRGLLITNGKAAHTFSHGTEWDLWADRNCYACAHYNESKMGACALEGAALLHLASPALLELFGWTRDAQYPESFDYPEVCGFFRQRDTDEGTQSPPPFVDPSQMVLLADPTEDAAYITNAPIEVEVPHE